MLIIDPNFFSMYWPAAKMAQKQKSCSTKSPLMLWYHWYFQYHPCPLSTYLVLSTWWKNDPKGIWIDNDLRGEVKHYFPAKNRTEIEFWNAEGFFIGDRDQNDLPHGQATMNFHPNEEGKKKFTGLWQHGVKNGFGVLTWKKGDLWVWIFCHLNSNLMTCSWHQKNETTNSPIHEFKVL